jgi:hypothetical protein
MSESTRTSLSLHGGPATPEIAQEVVAKMRSLLTELMYTQLQLPNRQDHLAPHYVTSLSPSRTARIFLRGQEVGVGYTWPPLPDAEVDPNATDALAVTLSGLAAALVGLQRPQRAAVLKMMNDLPSLVSMASDANRHARLRQWVDAISPVTLPEPLEERVVLASRRAIQSFIDRYHTSFLTAKQVSQQARLTGRNAAATPSKWVAEGKAFRLMYEGGQYAYPGFQFDDAGMPRTILKPVLAALRATPNRDDWGIAVWFGANNGWLGGREPAQCLATEADQVLIAAEQDAAHLEH